MSRPPEQRNTIPPSRWIRLCQWLWDRRKFVWGVLIVGIIVGVIVNWLTSSTSIFTGTPLGTILLWIRGHLLLAGFIGVCLFFLVVLVGVVSHLAGVSTRAIPASDLQQSRSDLIRLLRKEYHRQITESLQGVTMMVLALQQRMDVVRSSVSLVSWRIDKLGDTSLPAPASIVQAYDDAGAGLLILGAPGAGKSTLLRELASELLTRAEDAATQPVPVIINLSSWAIKKPPLTTWMVDRLWETYNIPPRLSQAGIEQNQLLFLLDGLDEVEVSARANCIEAINAYQAAQEQIIPIVVCSRSHEYLEQEERLGLSLAVEVGPLTSEQVDSYLEGAGKSLAAVRATVRSNTVLRELMTTPLMLSTAMLAYRGKTIEDLPHLGSPEEQQRQIFENYVSRMLEQQGRKWHYVSQQTRKWLIYLAEQMKQHQLTEFYVEQLQLSWLPAKRARIAYKTLFGLIAGLVAGLVGGLLGGLLVGLVLGLVYGLVYGLFGVLAFGLLTWMFFRLSMVGKEITLRSEKLMWSWKSFLRQGPFIGLFYGLLIGLFTGLIAGPLGGLIYGLVAGLFFGSMAGLTTTQIDPQMRLRPNQGIQTSGWNALRIGIGVGLFIGLIAGPLGGLIYGLLIGLFAGLSIGLIYGGQTYLSYYLLRLLLWYSGAIPWYYVRFLEEATERILLQRVGGGYRFIHPLFLDYFASLAATPASPSSAHSSPSR